MTVLRELQIRQEKVKDHLLKVGRVIAPANDNSKKARFQTTWFKDIAESQIKEHVIDGVFGVGEFSVVVGPPGSGKSAIITDAAMHVAEGRQWHGKDVRKGFVVYFPAERKTLTERRMAAYRKRNAIADIPLAVVGGKLDMTNGLIDAQSLATEIKRLSFECGLDCVWIIIDTLSRTFGGGDQNYTKDMGRFIQSVDELIRTTGAHVTVIHHSGWAGERGKGAIDLDGAVDASFFVTNGKNGFLLKCDGANDAEEGAVAAFDLESVDVGVDVNGKVTTAPVVVPREITLIEKGHFPAAPTTNAAKALAALQKIIEENPDGEGKVEREAWRAEYYAACRAENANVKPDALKARFKRAQEDLLKKDVLNDGDTFWLAP